MTLLLSKSLASRMSAKTVARRATEPLIAGDPRMPIRDTGPSRRTTRNLTMQPLSHQGLLALLVTSSTQFLPRITDQSSLRPGCTYGQLSRISVSRKRPLLSRKLKLVSCVLIRQEITVETTAPHSSRASPSQTTPCLLAGWNVGRNITNFCTAHHHSSVTWWFTTEPCHPASLPTLQLPCRWSSRLLMIYRMPSYPFSKSRWRDLASPAMSSSTPDQTLIWSDMPMPNNWGYLGHQSHSISK